MQFQTELRNNESSFDEKDVLDDCVTEQPKGTEKFFSSLILRLEYLQRTKKTREDRICKSLCGKKAEARRTIPVEQQRR